MSLITLYDQSNFHGKRVKANVCGDYRNFRRLGMANKSLASLKLSDDVIVEIYENENFQGDVRRFRGPVELPHLGDFDRRASSIRVFRPDEHPRRHGMDTPTTDVHPNGQLPNGQRPNGQLPNGQLPNGQVPPVPLPAQKDPNTPSTGLTTPTPANVNGLPNGNGGNVTPVQPGALVYTDVNFRGTSVPLNRTQDLPRIRSLGLPEASLGSIKVAPGATVTLFSEENFQGQQRVIKGPAQVGNLKSSFPAGVKSLKITYDPNTVSLQEVGGIGAWGWILIILLILVLIFFICKGKSTAF